jgi:uncharacterized protein (DUF2237 family)
VLTRLAARRLSPNGFLPLDFFKARGNDLARFRMPGLAPGERWRLCAARWSEALEADTAPRVVLAATHEKTLEIVEVADLKLMHSTWRLLRPTDCWST